MGVREIGVSLLMGLLVCTTSWSQDVTADGQIEHAASAADVEFFESSIAPILEHRCFQCHSHASGIAKGGLVLDSRRGWEQGGSEGAAVVPGKPDESLLMEAVRYESYEMPPDEQLPADEIALLEKWIAMGAPDPRESPDPAIASEQLWALQPITKPDVPAVDDTDWVRDDLDAFILQRLENERLTPAGDADRYTLLRRVTFDLTGLPPTPDEIAAFVNDQDNGAYEDAVDRLLNSPAFGDHWARHWFDLSCYADLADLQGDVLIRDAWRYRDYVIAALNADKPLDRFIHEQIAGDLLPYESDEQRREQIIATGYLAIGPWTLQNYIKQQLEADIVDHQIDRIGRTFLGQTLGCARCHDHKFDPVPTADYYALAGVFHSTLTTKHSGPGVWSAINETLLPDLTSLQEERALRRHELAELYSRRETLQSQLTTLLLTIPGGSEANVLTLEAPVAANEQGTEYEVSFQSGPSVWALASQCTTAADGLQIDLLRDNGSVLTVFRHNPGPWSGSQDAQTLQPASFTYTGDGSGGIRIRITSAVPGNSRFGGAIDDLRIAAGGRTSFSENFDDLRRGSVASFQADTSLPVLAQAVIPRWVGGGLNHSHAVYLGSGDFAIQFYGGGSLELAAAKPVLAAEKEALATAIELKNELECVAADIAAAEREDAPEYALAVCDTDKPADSPIYRRGDFQNLGEIVPRGFLAAIPTSTSDAIPPGASGRLQLAHWLTAPDNPLTSRVLVNRIWHHLFGTGLVRTVDYFGVHGETPSHPELLDFLAARMAGEDEWSLKKSVRRMVLSRTYQMASTHHVHAVEVDPDNRLLWRMPRRRLTAESIRDAMLAASGRLDPGRGGSPLGLELEGNIVGLGGNVNPPTWAGTIPDDIRNRRSVYLPFKRQRPLGELEILTVFDFPHPNDITGARATTTVATQALFLLNSPFVKQQAEALANRLMRDEPDDERAQIHRLYLLTVGRPATLDDIDTAVEFLEQSAAELNGDRSAAWIQLCQAMLSSNAFLFRE